MNATSSLPTSVYVAVGARLTNFVLDTSTGELTEGRSLTLPSRAQYGWAHATLPVLYVGCADRGPSGGSQPFYLCAYMRDESGDLAPLGEPVQLPARPIHLTTTDVPSAHVVVAYGDAPGLSVFATEADGSIGAELPRIEPFDFGTKPHSVRVTPDNTRAILVARGVKGFGKPAYVEGAFKSVRFDGEVQNVASVAPTVEQAPRGFNPRNIDFHPTKPLLFATLEAQNELSVFALDGGEVDPAPLFTANILAHPDQPFKRQDGGEVHIHPSGRTAYVANRNDGYAGGQSGPSWLTPDPIPTFAGGENNIAVFTLDEATGEPTLVQHEDTRGLHARTIDLDARGRILVAANVAPTRIQDGDALVDVPASLAIFRIGDDGRLEFVRTHALDVGQEKLWWMGVVG